MKNMTDTKLTRKNAANAINTAYQYGLVEYQCLNESTISDLKHPDTREYIKSIAIGGFQFFTRSGLLFNGMHNRCKIDGATWRNQPAYRGASVCDLWFNFEEFSLWCRSQIGYHQVDQNGNPFQLDSDLFSNGIKHYSPSTCCFLPKAINVALSGNGSKGYYKSGGKFKSQLTVDGTTKYLGTFDTTKQAKEAYKNAREAHIRSLAERYKQQIDVRAYDALMNYKQK